METVNCIRKLQRAGDGASPVRVNTAEDHSGVSVPKVADIHKSETYRLEKISSRYELAVIPPLSDHVSAEDARTM